MNKADITISHINNCKTFDEAIKKILNPVAGFGYKLTKNEISFCIHYAKLYFADLDR